SGQLARVIEALPTRMLLRTGTKLEHLAAGGDNDGYRRDRPAGRARIDEREVQIAWTDTAVVNASVEPGAAMSWVACAAVVGVIGPGVRRVLGALRSAHPEFAVTAVGDEATAQVGEPPRRIIVGDGEGWQRQWSLWQRIRSDG